MSQPLSDPVVSTQYLQIKLPRVVQSSGDNLASGCQGKDGENMPTTSNSVIDTSPQRCRSKGPSPTPSCISSTVINLTPSINTAPVSSESNCYFQTRDFLSEEAKQAAANLRDTMAAIADKRSMFFSECPKSPKHSLDTKLTSKVTPPAEPCHSEQQPPMQRSSLILERNKDSQNFEVTSRDDNATLHPLTREHPRLTPERTMSGYYFPNQSKSGPGRISLKTFELIKNCPSLELYTTAPITAMTATPPVNLRPKISPPPLQVSPPPSLSLVSSKPITLEIADPAVATSRPSSSPDKFLRISISPCNTLTRRARTVSREEVPACPESEMLPTAGPEQNGEHSPLPTADTYKPQMVSNLHDVRFFSAPEAYPFQECEQDTEGRGSDDKIQPGGDDSLPSTPNSGSLSSSMKGSGINKLKSFFCDNTNVFEGRQGDTTGEPDTPQQKLSASEGTSRLEKGSFKVKKSNSKQLPAVPTSSQGSPKQKKSPTEKEPQQPKESWKGRVARTIKRYGSGSILLSSDPSPSLSTPDDGKTTKVVTLQPQGVFGVPLEVCEVSPNYDLVPLIVEVCVRIVEEKGLDNQGIYRVPGNTGAIKELQDEINKDPKGLCLDSEKWQDVNLVTSLLKLFFRKLPDSLITDRLYEPVIATTRLEKSEKRMLKLKRILHDMPERNFNTFSLLAKHLNLVASHEENNKMDAHNLAIMFGPTLVRPQDNNIAVMARNMADQCRVVEMIVIHCDWFFSSWDEDVNVPMDGESEELTPVIDEKMVAKAQSLGNACQKSSSSSSLHQLPSLVLSPSSSSISSLPLTSPTGWNVMVKKFKPPNPRDRTYPPVACPAGLKSSSSDAILSGKNPLFSPTSKKNFFSWVGKAWNQNKPPKPEQLGLVGRELLLSREAPPSLCVASNCNDPLEGRVGVPLEIEVKVVRRDRYNLDGQSFGLADNREPPKLPWQKGEGSSQDHAQVFHSVP